MAHSSQAYQETVVVMIIEEDMIAVVVVVDIDKMTGKSMHIKIYYNMNKQHEEVRSKRRIQKR